MLLNLLHYLDYLVWVVATVSLGYNIRTFIKGRKPVEISIVAPTDIVPAEEGGTSLSLSTILSTTEMEKAALSVQNAQCPEDFIKIGMLIERAKAETSHPDAGRWRLYLPAPPAIPTLPPGAYQDNPLRSYERIVERISELQTGIHEALEANDIQVLRDKALVQPKDWIGIRFPLTTQVDDPLLLEQ